VQAARRLPRALQVRLLCIHLKQWSAVFCLYFPSADIERSGMDINNIKIWTAINDIIAHAEYQTFTWEPQWVYLGFLLKQRLSKLKNIVHAWR